MAASTQMSSVPSSGMQTRRVSVTRLTPLCTAFSAARGGLLFALGGLSDCGLWPAEVWVLEALERGDMPDGVEGSNSCINTRHGRVHHATMAVTDSSDLVSMVL